jgi:acylphosphatase
VGYRFFARRQASALGLSGYVRNLADGSVEVVAEGSRAMLEQLRRELERGPTGADVDEVDARWSTANGTFGTFQIRH